MSEVATREDFSDPPGFKNRTVDELLADPFERTALTLYYLSFSEPEDVAVLLEEPASFAQPWMEPLGVGRGERRHWRRRAAVVIAAHEGGA